MRKRKRMRWKWTLASIVAFFVVALIFAPTLANLFFRILTPLDQLAWQPSYTQTARTLFSAAYWLYQLARNLLTNPVHLALILAVSLVLMAFGVTRR